MISYLDSCALLKLVKPEQETAALRSWVKALPDGDTLVTSELAELEITRTLIRHGATDTEVTSAMAGIFDLVDAAVLSPAVLRAATAYRIRRLGSLDALHLATAGLFGSELAQLVTYDTELAAAATQTGFTVVAPS